MRTVPLFQSRPECAFCVLGTEEFQQTGRCDRDGICVIELGIDNFLQSRRPIARKDCAKFLPGSSLPAAVDRLVDRPVLCSSYSRRQDVPAAEARAHRDPALRAWQPDDSRALSSRPHSYLLMTPSGCPASDPTGQFPGGHWIPAPDIRNVPGCSTRL